MPLPFPAMPGKATCWRRHASRASWQRRKQSDLIPLCHPIALTSATVDFEPLAKRSAIRIIATAKTAGPTGVEMEALTAASIAALTIYDMVKAVDRAAQIEGVRLIAKSGGKSGEYRAEKQEEKPSIATRLAKARAKPSTLMGEVASPRPAAEHLPGAKPSAPS